MKWPLRWFKKFKKKDQRQPRLMKGQDGYTFRRSRTLSDGSARDVTANSDKGGQLTTDRLKLHELKKHRRKIVRMLGGVVIAIAVLAFLVANFIISPNISVTQPGDNAPNLTHYQDSISSYFGSHPLERFGSVLRAGQLEDYLLQMHPELTNVAVERAWYGGNVQFAVFFSKPLLKWEAGGDHFYVDDRGKAYEYNHFSAPPLAVTDETGLPPNEYGMVASARFIQFLGRLVGAVNSYDVGKVEHIVLPPSTREIVLRLKYRDYPIRTNSDRDPLQQAEDIANALWHFDEQGIAPEYIDARVPHRAYYR